MKRRVNPTNKTIENPKAINNSIKKRGFYPSMLDRLSIKEIMSYLSHLALNF